MNLTPLTSTYNSIIRLDTSAAWGSGRFSTREIRARSAVENSGILLENNSWTHAVSIARTTNHGTWLDWIFFYYRRDELWQLLRLHDARHLAFCWMWDIQESLGSSAGNIKQSPITSSPTVHTLVILLRTFLLRCLRRGKKGMSPFQLREC